MNTEVIVGGVLLACAKSGSEQGEEKQRVRVIYPLPSLPLPFPAPPPLLVVALVAKLAAEVGLREVRVGVSVVSKG